MRRISPPRGVLWLIPFADRGTGSALISFAGGGRSQARTHLVFFLVTGGISGETVISGEGGLLDAASGPVTGEPVEDSRNAGGMISIFGRSQLRLMVVNFLASSGGSGDSEGIVIRRVELSSLVMI